VLFGGPAATETLEEAIDRPLLRMVA